LHDAFCGRGLGDGEGEKGIGREEEEVLCLRVAGVGWFRADVLRSGRLVLQVIVHFTLTLAMSDWLVWSCCLELGLLVVKTF
jgi:hypothetical protein